MFITQTLEIKQDPLVLSQQVLHFQTIPAFVFFVRMHANKDEQIDWNVRT